MEENNIGVDTDFSKLQEEEEAAADGDHGQSRTKQLDRQRKQ